MRTTLNIDRPVLAELKAIQKQEGKSLGRLVSDLLITALRDRDQNKKALSEPLQWNSKRMGARVELSDRDALHDLLDEGQGR